MSATATRFNAVRYAEMIRPNPDATEADMLGLTDLPGYLGNLYGADSMNTWRRNARDDGGHGPVALPPPDKVISRGRNNSRVLWYPWTIDLWLCQTGRRCPITRKPQKPRQPGRGKPA